VRQLAPTLQAIYGDPNLIGPLQIQSSIGRSRYDELVVQFQRRLPRGTLQMNYALSRAYAYAGEIAQSAFYIPPSQDVYDIFAPGEWGPTPSDERHRFVVYGVIDLPYGLQVSPVFQAATPRPYNLVAGLDLNGDGQTNASAQDRYVDPATGQQPCAHAPRVRPSILSS
jgi:hypothetical protein